MGDMILSLAARSMSQTRAGSERFRHGLAVTTTMCQFRHGSSRNRQRVTTFDHYGPFRSHPRAPDRDFVVIIANW
jgi:hypothetical protein